MPKLPKKLQDVIAKEILHIETLETRNSDRLDFPDMAVWSVKEALLAAYLAGMAKGLEPKKPSVVVKGFVQ